MTRSRRWSASATALVVLLVGALVGACSGGGPASEHVVLADSLDRLRSDFNDEVGKVRAIFLASPT